MIIGIVSRPGLLRGSLGDVRFSIHFYVPLSLHIKTLELTGRGVRSSDPDDNRDCIETVLVRESFGVVRFSIHFSTSLSLR